MIYLYPEVRRTDFHLRPDMLYINMIASSSVLIADGAVPTAATAAT